MISLTEEPPDTDRLFVPLRTAACGVSLRLFRDRGGERCAVGFTGLDLLIELLGTDQQYYRLTARVVRSIAAERGVTRLVVDPALVAAPVGPVHAEGPVPMAPAALASYAAPARETAGATRAAWELSAAAGVLAVSAGAGVAALVLEALK